MPTPATTDVSHLLTQTFGRHVEIVSLNQVEPWCVARCAISVDEQIQTVILKWRRDGDPDDPDARAAPSQLTTEARTLEFLADLGVNNVPQLVVFDPATPMLIMSERVGTPLDQVIRDVGHSERTQRHLVEYALSLARQHAATAAAVDAFHTHLSHLDPVRERRRFLSRNIDVTEAVLVPFGCPAASRQARLEASEVHQRLDEPGAFLALSNGDAGMNNFLVESASVIDFEFAGYRHCLIDLVEFYLPGPGWLAVADPVASGLEDAYRDLLAETIPDVADTSRFDADLAAACLTWGRIRLNNFPRVDARAPGDPSRLQRLVTVESAGRIAEARGQFPALAQWYREIGSWLRHRWPDADVDWAQIEPYRPRE